MMTDDPRRCPSCRQPTLVRAGPVAEWSTDPPPVDADRFTLWRCTNIVRDALFDLERMAFVDAPCGFECKRRDDGRGTDDPRWWAPIEGLHT